MKNFYTKGVLTSEIYVFARFFLTYKFEIGVTEGISRTLHGSHGVRDRTPKHLIQSKGSVGRGSIDRPNQGNRKSKVECSV